MYDAIVHVGEFVIEMYLFCCLLDLQGWFMILHVYLSIKKCMIICLSICVDKYIHSFD